MTLFYCFSTMSGLEAGIQLFFGSAAFAIIANSIFNSSPLKVYAQCDGDSSDSKVKCGSVAMKRVLSKFFTKINPYQPPLLLFEGTLQTAVPTVLRQLFRPAVVKFKYHRELIQLSGILMENIQPSFFYAPQPQMVAQLQSIGQLMTQRTAPKVARQRRRSRRSC